MLEVKMAAMTYDDDLGPNPEMQTQFESIHPEGWAEVYRVTKKPLPHVSTEFRYFVKAGEEELFDPAAHVRTNGDLNTD